LALNLTILIILKEQNIPIILAKNSYFEARFQDKYGSSGNNVYLLEKNILKILVFKLKI
jgi:hypothetical protein